MFVSIKPVKNSFKINKKNVLFTSCTRQSKLTEIKVFLNGQIIQILKLTIDKIYWISYILLF